MHICAIASIWFSVCAIFYVFFHIMIRYWDLFKKCWSYSHTYNLIFSDISSKLVFPNNFSNPRLGWNICLIILSIDFPRNMKFFASSCLRWLLNSNKISGTKCIFAVWTINPMSISEMFKVLVSSRKNFITFVSNSVPLRGLRVNIKFWDWWGRVGKAWKRQKRGAAAWNLESLWSVYIYVFLWDPVPIIVLPCPKHHAVVETWIAWPRIENSNFLQAYCDVDIECCRDF